jgi:acetate kinase
MRVLVLNSGSSSQKSALYEIGATLPQDPPEPVWKAEIEWGTSSAKLRLKTSREPSREEQVPVSDRQGAIERMLQTLWSGSSAVVPNAAAIDAVGHRIVHGGDKLTDATLVTPEVRSVISSVAVFAPLHNRAELEGIETVERLIGKVKQIAVFDTAFHRTLPLTAAVYPGPYSWFEHGIRRYGFHGINHEYCAGRVAQILKHDLKSLKVVSCHLGNGCSLAAIAEGRSIDTTMGFTPLDGLMMGTRSGAVDPSILTYLMRQSGATGGELDDTLNKKSGLLGISGVSSDLRDIMKAIENGNSRAQLALDIFVHRLRQGIAAMAASLQGLDVLIFTGGIGEHSREVRSRTCEGLSFLGVRLDPGQNSASPADQRISTDESKVKVLLIRAQEDWAIAKASAEIVAGT